MYYIYLHGFASSPRSLKARYLCDRFAKAGISLHILDLNQDDFSHLTLSRQLQQVKESFPDADTPITIIGSSFGGLTALWLSQQCPQVKQIICLCPAFNFLNQFLAKIGEEKKQKWQETGYLSVYHYGQNRRLPLHYEFITDVQKYPDSELKCTVPTLILHGRYDEVIPIQASQDYQKNFPQVKLIELESNHTLGNVIPQLWQEVQKAILFGDED